MVEPELQPLTGETLACATSNPSDGARLDIAVNGFRGDRYEKSFLDVRVFNSHAPSNNKTSINSCYQKHENEKKKAYEQRICEVEHSSFTPLVLSATGSMAKQSTTFYKRLYSLPSCREMGPGLQLYTVLVALSNFFLSVKIGLSMHLS